MPHGALQARLSEKPVCPVHKQHPRQLHQHLLLDKHAGEQLELVDMLAERVQTLGGVAVGDPRHVAEITAIPRPQMGDDGTNDLLVSNVIRTGELEAWFLAEHLVDTPLVRA
jgi:starvation-inducible DNA-binding protein